MSNMKEWNIIERLSKRIIKKAEKEEWEELLELLDIREEILRNYLKKHTVPKERAEILIEQSQILINLIKKNYENLQSFSEKKGKLINLNNYKKNKNKKS